MREKKGFIIKTGLLLLLLAAVLVIVGFFLYQMTSKTAIGNLKETQKFSTSSSASSIDNELTSNVVGTQSATNLTNFTAKGILKGDKIAMTLSLSKIVDGQMETTLTESSISSQGVREGLIGNSVNLYLKRDAGNNGALPDASNKYIWYVSPTSGEEKTYSVLVQTHEQLFEQVNQRADSGAQTFYALACDNDIFLSSDVARLSLHSNWRSAIKCDIGSSIKEEDFGEQNAQVVSAVVGEQNYLVGLYMLESPVGDLSFYYISFTDYAIIQGMLSKYTLEIATILGLCLFLVAVCCVCYGALLLRGRRKIVRRDNVIRIDNAESYALSIDMGGAIMESQVDFDRHFSVRSLTEGLAYNAFHDGMKVGNTFMTTIMDHKGTKHFMNVTIACVLPKKKGYKIIAGDISDLSTAVAKGMSIELSQSEGNKMSEAYAKLIWSHKKLLIGRVHVANLTNLQVMFGKHFSDDIFTAVIEKAAKRFDMVFPNRGEDSIGVISYEAPDLSVRAEELKIDMSELNKPINVDDNLVTVGCEGGFNLVERGVGESGFDYIDKCIRAARRRASEEEGRSYFLYHDFQKKQFMRYMDKEYDIKQMLMDDSFEMQFQPQYSVKEKRVAGFESLFRFKKSLNLEINTFEFIQYAERTGSMILLGNFIFESSMRFAKSLESKGVAVSLNVSPVQLMQVGFTENLLRLYREFELKKGSICVEITESFLMTTMEETLLKLDLLVNEGIDVHLDDFGTLYSSLLYLKKLPISAIKIDMEFIKDLCTDDYCRDITQMVINISHQLGVESIAEGVETEEQKTLLAKMGCDVLQGYLIGKAMTQQEAIKLL